jgi:hypothetical protein
MYRGPPLWSLVLRHVDRNRPYFPKLYGKKVELLSCTRYHTQSVLKLLQRTCLALASVLSRYCRHSTWGMEGTSVFSGRRDGLLPWSFASQLLSFVYDENMVTKTSHIINPLVPLC